MQVTTVENAGKVKFQAGSSSPRLPTPQTSKAKDATTRGTTRGEGAPKDQMMVEEADLISQARRPLQPNCKGGRASKGSARPCRLCYSAGNKHRQGQQQSLQEGHWGAEDPGLPRNFARCFVCMHIVLTVRRCEFTRPRNVVSLHSTRSEVCRIAGHCAGNESTRSLVRIPCVWFYNTRSCGAFAFFFSKTFNKRSKHLALDYFVCFLRSDSNAGQVCGRSMKSNLAGE